MQEKKFLICSDNTKVGQSAPAFKLCYPLFSFLPFLSNSTQLSKGPPGHPGRVSVTTPTTPEAQGSRRILVPKVGGPNDHRVNIRGTVPGSSNDLEIKDNAGQRGQSYECPRRTNNKVT